LGAPGLGAADLDAEVFEAAVLESPLLVAAGLAAPGFAAVVFVAEVLAAALFDAAVLVAVFLAPVLAPLPGLSPAESALFDAYSSFKRRTTGASTVEDAERTNSPIDSSFASTSLLVVPSCFASSWTRGLATFLLSGLLPDRKEPHRK